MVDLIVSRIDLLASAGSVSEAYASRKQGEIRDEFEAACGDIRLWSIAARPEGEFHETKDRIAELFTSWLEDIVRLQTVGGATVTIGHGERDFVRFPPNGGRES